jgi:hypothetical protein
LILNAADHECTIASVFDRGAHVIERRIINSYEPVVKLVGGADFERDVFDVHLAYFQRDAVIRSEEMCRNGDIWLRIDEQTDVVVSLSECLHCIRKLGEEPAFWKWAILSLHNALQGAMVCHLSGTAQLGALGEESIKRRSDRRRRVGADI